MNISYKIKLFLFLKIHIRRAKQAKFLSRITWYSHNSMKEKFGIKTLNSTKEVLLLDKINNDSK